MEKKKEAVQSFKLNVRRQTQRNNENLQNLYFQTSSCVPIIPLGIALADGGGRGLHSSCSVLTDSPNLCLFFFLPCSQVTK